MRKIEILFEDEEILVVVKPAGILSQGNLKGEQDMVSLLKGQLCVRRRREGVHSASLPYVAVIHRLDRAVRGIMVYAKTREAASRLSAYLQRGDFQKVYLAMVDRKKEDGLKVSETFIRLGSYLVYDKMKNCSFLSEDGMGDFCLLDYKVLSTKEEKALLLIHLITGRRHQIRVQMTEISEGIYGDRKYHLKKASTFEEKEGLALECISLSFTHPFSGERLSFQIEPGAVFSAFNNSKEPVCRSFYSE